MLYGYNCEQEFDTNLFRCVGGHLVFGKITNLHEQYPELVEQANQILNKCGGLPLAIVTIGCFLANQQKTALKWRRLNEHISAELKMNPELESINAVLTKSYDGLHYHLKLCFLYMPIFPEDCEVSRGRLVRRCIAEGYSYSSVVLSRSAEEMAESYFRKLISRNMLLPCKRLVYSRKDFDSCKVHDLIRDIGIKKSMGENLVFRLEKGCRLSSKSRVRHLAISGDWRRDKNDFETIVDLSHVRSLTVFGEWKPFFISNKMRLLRVLDLEDTLDLFDHDIQHIGKLLHLKYLSIRGCDQISHLPDSLGNLRQLETLDVRYTSIVKLPKSLIKLQKLKYVRAGIESTGKGVSYEELVENLPEITRKNNLCLLTLWLAMLSATCCGRPFDYFSPPDPMNRRDICTVFCCFLLPSFAMRLDIHGVLAPRGIKKLKALHTLGVVNIARGKVIQDIKDLTQLRKLGVTGINKRNSPELCSALANLSHLESLSVRSEGMPGLCGCLDAMSTLHPKTLQSLKLYGNLVKLPEWIQGLQYLVKLNLRSTRIWAHDAAMEVLGKIPNLSILRLLEKSFQGEKLCFQIEAFRSLIVLVLEDLGDIKSVMFEQGTMPKLEQLNLRDYQRKNEIAFFGLDILPSIKEVQLDVGFLPDYSKMDSSDLDNTREQIKELKKEAKFKEEKIKEHFRTQLSANQKKPTLEMS